MGMVNGKMEVTLNIAYMSNVVHFSREDMESLSLQFRELAAVMDPPEIISRDLFTQTLDIIGLKDSDREILDKCFTLFDDEGDNLITWRCVYIHSSPAAVLVFFYASYVP